MWRSSTSSLALLCTVPRVFAGLFDAPKPLIAFSHPKSFLGLENEFTQRVDTVAFLPGLHACGTLTIVALDDIGPESPAGPSLAFADFDAWPRSNETREAGDGAAPRKTLMDLWDDAEDAVVESKALEGTVLAWSKGWRNTCGPGAVNKQVRVVAVGSKDLLGTNGMTREEYLRHLDARITLHLSRLEAPPHNNLVVVTPVSPATQRLMFDVTSPARPSHPPEWKVEYPVRRKRERGIVERILARLIDMAILAAAVIGIASLGKWAWSKYQDKKGRIQLPFTRGEEEAVLDLDAE
ncbi:hypothetical protein JCM3766R1_006758 [Sporobolomyces carnicolor]